MSPKSSVIFKVYNITSWKQAACSPLLDFLLSGEVFDIEDSSDEDTLFRLFGVSSRVSAIKNRRAIELKARETRLTHCEQYGRARQGRR